MHGKNPFENSAGKNLCNLQSRTERSPPRSCVSEKPLQKSAQKNPKKQPTGKNSKNVQEQTLKKTYRRSPAKLRTEFSNAVFRTERIRTEKPNKKSILEQLTEITPANQVMIKPL